MSGFDNDTVYANNADFSRAGAGGGSPLNGLQLNGQLWIGGTSVNAGGTHVNVGTLTSNSGTLTITNGLGTINLEVAGGGTVTETLTGNSGGPIAPLAANINTVGAGSITISGVAGTHTLTTQLTGLNNHAVLVGAGTATITNVGPSATAGQILQSAGGAADPTFSTATYPSTTTINQILYSSSTNVVGGITAGNNGVLISGTTGIPSWLPDGVTGQILTAVTNSPPIWSNPASSGTVTSVSVVTNNGFAGTVANPTTTPAITISTTQTGLLTGNGTALIGTPITQYSVLTAGASNLPNSVAPSATVGIPLISKGIVAQPDFGTAVVAGGGTGATSFVAYTPVCGGTTSTAPLQSVVSTGTSGQVLTSNGAGFLPTFQNASSGGGGWQLIQTQTVAAAAFVLFSTNLSNFTELMFVWTSLAVNGGAFKYQASSDNGATLITGTTAQLNSDTWSNTSSGTDFLGSGTGGGGASLSTGYFTIQNTPGTFVRVSVGSVFANGGSPGPVFSVLNASPVINWVKLINAIFTGTVTLFGR